MNFYISDLHLGHKNIINLSKRPFSNIEEMDEVFINNWNETVSNNDDVYVLGDLCYKGGKHPKEYLERLKGKKHLIIGNHDSKIMKDFSCRKYFVEMKDIITINDNGKMVILCHYPMLEWNGFFRENIHLYGHIHNNVDNNTYKIISKIDNAYNVGTDILGFYPRTLEEVIKLNKEFNHKHKKIQQK